MPLSRIKRTLYRYYLKRKESKLDIIRKPLGLAEAQKIGFLFNASDPSNYVLVNKYVKQLKDADKRVEILGYFDFKHMEGDVSYMHFSKKDLNFYWQPRDNISDYFIKKEFDILINAYTRECLPLEYISTLSHARYRVAMFQETKPNIADFHIKLKSKEPQLSQLLEETEHFLTMIKANDK